MEYEWSEEKYRSNIVKHKVYFEDAIEVFEDPDELTEPARVVDGEERLQTIGAVPFLAVLLVVHTLRETIKAAW